jgi:hypothetical protein
LVALNLDVDEEVQISELGKQARRVPVVVHAQQCRVERDADNVRVLEALQLGSSNVVGHDRDSLEPPFAPRDRVEQTLVVVLAVAGVRADDHGIAHPVRVEHPRQLVRCAHFLTGRQVVAAAA